MNELLQPDHFFPTEEPTINVEESINKQVLDLCVEVGSALPISVYYMLIGSVELDRTSNVSAVDITNFLQIDIQDVQSILDLLEAKQLIKQGIRIDILGPAFDPMVDNFDHMYDQCNEYDFFI